MDSALVSLAQFYFGAYLLPPQSERMMEEFGVLAVFAMGKNPQKSIKMSYFKVAMKKVGFGRDLTNNRTAVDSNLFLLPVTLESNQS